MYVFVPSHEVLSPRQLHTNWFFCLLFVFCLHLNTSAPLNVNPKSISYLSPARFSIGTEIDAAFMLVPVAAVYNTVGAKFSDRDKDLIIVAIILHDGFTRGKKLESHTKFDHPLLASEFIFKNKSKLSLEVDDIRKICSMIESHMGEYTIDPNTDREVLPRPRTMEQRFVHMCDYLASRKFLDIKFVDGEIKE